MFASQTQKPETTGLEKKHAQENQSQIPPNVNQTPELIEARADVNKPDKDGYTPVCIAAAKGRTETIRALHALGANVNTPSKDGRTPVFIAAQMGHASAIAALHALGANVDRPMLDGRTPVFIAAQKGHASAIAALHAAGANVNTPEKNGETPVFIAAEKGHASAIAALHAAGANVNTPEKTVGATPVYIAALMGHASAIAALHAAGANVNTPLPDGATPVYIAARNGHASAIAALHAAGAAMNTPANSGTTPVYIAALMGHASAIAALHALGANVNTPDKDGQTPVYVAAAKGHASVIAALHVAGANVNTPHPDGRTPVYIAAYDGHASAIAALHALGANVNTPSKDGRTPVYIAAQKGHASAIAALHAAGAAMNTPANSGATPVYIAAQMGHASAITALHAAGANMNTPHPDGWTPVYIAADKGHASAIAALHAAGANVNTPHPDGWTPVYIAADKGHASAIAALHAAGANMNTPHPDGWTPVYIAADKGHASAIAALHAAGANVNMPANSGATPVFAAAQMGHASAITALHAAGANVNTPDNDGATPVYCAAFKGHAAAITTLHAANVNTPLPDGRTPVYIAAFKGHASAIAALYALGANVNTPLPDGRTPVFVAANNGHASAIAALHAAGANVDTPLLLNGTTPVYVAANNGHAKAIAALHAAGANVNTPRACSTTPACITIKVGMDAATIAAAFHAAGENVDTLDKNFATPVYCAAFKGHAAAVTALLEAGADASIKTKWGTTLECARQGKEPGHSEVVRLLEAHFKEHPNGIKPASVADKESKECAESLTSASLPPVNQEVKTKHDFPPAPKKPPPSRSPQPPITLEDASNPVASDNSLLQNLQAQLMKGKKQTTASSFSLSDMPAESKFLHELVRGLEKNQIEKQELEQSSQELKTQSDRLHETLEKEIITQKSELMCLKQQKKAFQKQIESLSQTSGIDQQSIQTSLKALQEQLLVVKTQQAILWNEHEIKAQKREALKRFQGHPNLLLFYRTVHIKLEEIFISFKAVAGGFARATNGNIAIAKSIFDVIGDVATITPIIGPAVDKILKWSISQGLKKLDRARQKNIAKNASELVTLSEVKKYAESIARQLTERYADQLQRLATAEEEQAETHRLKKGLAKMGEAALKDTCVPPAKQLAAFGVLWIIDQLYDAASIDESKKLDEALLTMISQKSPANKLKEFWQKITKELGIKGVRAKNGETWETWHPEAVYTLPGIRTVGNEYYSAETLEPQRYGWRLGTAQEAQALGLKQVPPPLAPAFVLEHEKAVQSIKKMEQKTDEHSAILDRMGKTMDIAGNAQLKALQTDLAQTKKELERLVELHARAASPSPKRRPSGIKAFTKQSEQENMLDALKELRKFFMGQRDKGEQSLNLDTYEKYLKMVNKDAELIYQQEDKKHILCIDGNVLDATAAAQAIWKMIKDLENRPQPMLTQFGQPGTPASAQEAHPSQSASVLKSA